ncbi:MAG TPA: deoxyribose-phosphate aldolase [Candidatus Acidoferrales bacterium]|nr:deoxyribose-phosphate aldolase [Candidatus Acidoferrales bacterium]
MSSRNSAADRKRLAESWQSVASLIDHTNLRPEATPDQIVRLCAEAREFGFGAVMINPCYVALAGDQLRGGQVKVGAVVGFPLGATLTIVKVLESQEALKLGAREIDMVMNIGWLKAGEKEDVRSDIRAVAEVVHPAGALLKVILETGLLTTDEKLLACEISEGAGADFVKTSTGFLGGVATVEDVTLMRGAVRIGVKASGGIRTAADARKMIEAGADRLGTSSGVKIVAELRDELAKRLGAPKAGV